MIVTTSWDDGHRLDLRLGELLSRYQLKGTFYIARDFLEERLSDAEIIRLSKSHEIGAHTLNHPVLTEISLADAETEITGSKHWLESLLGQAVTSFCYPKGAKNPELEKLVEKAQYTMARSVESYQLGIGTNRFAVPTSLQVYPFPFRPLPNIPFPRGIPTRLQPLRRNWRAIRQMGIGWSALRSWESLALASLAEAQRINGVWHLWGHSWEIEAYQMWESLERVLAAAQAYAPLALSNSELILMGDKANER